MISAYAWMTRIAAWFSIVVLLLLHMLHLLSEYYCFGQVGGATIMMVLVDLLLGRLGK